MKKLFSTEIPGKYAHIALLLTRIAVATFMLTHGIPKFNMLITGADVEFPDPLFLGPVASFALTVFAEVLCSIFILIGLATRLASIPLLITMMVAAFMIHADDPFGTKEKALLYLVLYLILLMMGGGKYSVDHVIQKKRGYHRQTTETQ